MFGCESELLAKENGHTSLDTPQRESKIPFFLTVLFVFRNMWVTKKAKNKKIHLKFFHLFHFLGKKKVFSAIFKHKIFHAA